MVSDMFQDAVSERFGSMRGISTDDFLSALGLERRRSFAASIAPIASGFAVGALAGAAVALLFAPKSGREVRRELKGRASEVTRRVGAAADEVMTEVRNVLPHGEKEEHSPRLQHSQENGERRPMEQHQPLAGRVSPPPK
jgi:gas vesicle protein